MRPWIAPLFVLALLLATPALAGHGSAEKAAASHEAHATVAVDPGRVGFTAVAVLILLGGGIGAALALREQLS